MSKLLLQLLSFLSISSALAFTSVTSLISDKPRIFNRTSSSSSSSTYNSTTTTNSLKYTKSPNSLRKKRDLIQLGYLIEEYTPYRARQLINHGNWCGLGGNRALDGSVQDQCDACCKEHDLCYFNLLYRTRQYYFREDNEDRSYNSNSRSRSRSGKNINSNSNSNSNSKISFGDEDSSDSGSGFTFQSMMSWPMRQMSRGCFPYADVYPAPEPKNGLSCSNESGVCSRGACICDVKLVHCLRYAKCDV